MVLQDQTSTEILSYRFSPSARQLSFWYVVRKKSLLKEGGLEYDQESN